ncbi:O-antigen ligase family protein [Thalassospira lucentensis]|uniref:O-antigen ligase family protein n=1 Tax=Thalassospira lucentensis TaxID=168935 RepID=UPI00142D2B88|nr:O-antigen ligase family protein [Thalassospira lucentensis]NIZ01279.1 O-antigen ligase family protein [Thalassospira lucentensis]
MLYRLAHICLLVQIILAAILLGGARVWAMGILSILTGIGLIAISLSRTTAKPPLIPSYIRNLWLLVGLVSGWMILQSLPIWPSQPTPFKADHIALYPHAWQGSVTDLIWCAASLTLGALLAQTQPHRFVQQVCITIICAAVIQVGLAALADMMGWKTTFWFAKTAHLSDWTGSFANRNAFAVLMVLGIIASLSCFMRQTSMSIGKRLDQQGGWLALAMVFGFALLQSHSRSGLVIAGLCLIVFGCLHIPTSRWSHRALIGLGLAGIAAFGRVLIALTSPEVAARFADLARRDLIQRDDAWASAIDAIMARPITGFGPGSIARVMDHFATPGLNTDANWFSSHNLWLDLALTLGIPMMLLVLITALYAGVKTWRSTQSPNHRALFLAGICIFVVSASVGWVITLPALILPLGLLWVGCAKAADAARHREGHAPADFWVQSAPPDQSVPTKP